ncbi:MFS transporter [Microbacterium sp. NPDC089696]|uniref:MFS transporter n=1 Tax=Microbacterium sp. NPDC089696 TaxID=3364199 RepID=UPI0038069DC5
MTSKTTVPRTDYDRRAAARVTTASAIGTVMEWYDFGLYGAASALVFAPLFFASSDPVIGVLSSFAVFAVGFFVRPLGGILAGHFGDRYGRKPILIMTIVLMGGATVAIGLLPTYESVGIFAPVLLVLVRMLQGLGAGAEFAAAVTAVAEYTPLHRRAFYTSFSQAAVAFALVLSTGTFALLSSLPEEILLGWAWRIPFIASIVIFLVAFFIRRRVEETPEFTEARKESAEKGKAQKLPIMQVLRERPRALLVGIFCGAALVNTGYVVNTFSLSYITNTLELPRTVATVGLVAAAVVATLTIPLFGMLADRIGRRPVYIGGAVFMALFALPLFLLLDTGVPVLVGLALVCAYGIGFAAMCGAQSAFLAELFPTRYRFSGVAAAREINAMLIGGTTPFIAAALVAAAGGEPTLVVPYMILCAVITIVALLLAPKPVAETDVILTAPNQK